MSCFRLVVFDWDGTLVDSIGTIIDCTRAVFEELGLQPVAERKVRSLIGTGLAESIRILAPDCDESTFHHALDTYRQLWVEQFHHRSALFEGAREVVEGLHHEGYLLAVATAKARRGLNLDLERLDIAPLLDASRTADEAPSKPSPEMLLQILDELGVRADQALMVGDSVHDILMAHNANVPAVAVASGAASPGTLQQLSPQACLTSVAELPAWLNGD